MGVDSLLILGYCFSDWRIRLKLTRKALTVIAFIKIRLKNSENNMLTEAWLDWQVGYENSMQLR